MRATASAALAATAFLCASAPAASETAANDASDQARAAYHDAQKAIAAGRCDQAVPKLEEGLRLLPVPKALLQLGDCFVKMGRLDFAATAYRMFLTNYPEHTAVERV